MNPVEAHYENFLATHYTWMSGGHTSGVESSRRRLTDFGIVAPSGGAALDLGCGSGYQSVALAELGFRVVAIDTSRHLLDELHEAATGQPITTVHGDMLQRSNYEPHGPYDAVVCMGDTLVHLQSEDEVDRLLADVHAVLQPGGKLLLSFRDLSTELRGIDRASPVRLDEDVLMATFLEYAEAHVLVHDMLFTRRDGQWRMSKSVYPKLRLSGTRAAEMLASAGFDAIQKTIDGGFTFLFAQKPCASLAEEPTEP